MAYEVGAPGTPQSLLRFPRRSTAAGPRLVYAHDEPSCDAEATGKAARTIARKIEALDEENQRLQDQIAKLQRRRPAPAAEAETDGTLCVSGELSALGTSSASRRSLRCPPSEGDNRLDAVAADLYSSRLSLEELQRATSDTETSSFMGSALDASFSFGFRGLSEGGCSQSSPSRSAGISLRSPRPCLGPSGVSSDSTASSFRPPLVGADSAAPCASGIAVGQCQARQPDAPVFLAPPRSPRISITPSVCSGAGVLQSGGQCAALIAGDDSPGVFVVVRDVAVEPQPEIGTLEDVLAVLGVGRLINVLAIARSQSRIRGRIENPAGWISIIDTEDGYRWAQKQAAALQTAPPQMVPRSSSPPPMPFPAHVAPLRPARCSVVVAGQVVPQHLQLQCQAQQPPHQVQPRQPPTLQQQPHQQQRQQRQQMHPQQTLQLQRRGSEPTASPSAELQSMWRRTLLEAASPRSGQARSSGVTAAAAVAME